MKFEFMTSARIIFGSGTLKEIAPAAARMGKRAMVVTGKNADRAAPMLNFLKKEKIDYIRFSVMGEPEIDQAVSGVNLARNEKCDMVISMGGGSVIDMGKVIAAMLTNEGELFDYLEIIGEGKQISRMPVPCIAIPTTAGTGAEVTKNSVLKSPEHGVKVSMRSPMMIPDLAVVDPELTCSLGPDLTASTGMDALTQLIEAYVSLKGNTLVDSICRDGMDRASRSLWLAYEVSSDLEARENMCIASLFSGMALSNAGLGAVHGLSAPLGGMYTIPHGVVCARLLPYASEANIRALKIYAPGSNSLARYDEVARILTGKADAMASEGIAWIKNLCDALNIPNLAKFGVKKKDFSTIAAKALKASSMKGNPVVLTNSELIDILEKASSV